MTGFRVSVVLALCLVQWTFQVEGCQVEVEKIGCFADASRSLEQLLIYRRNTLADEELSVSLPRLLCDCAVLAESHGYTYIGLQYYAECWSTSEPSPDYGRDGPSGDCCNTVYEKCGDGDTECVGGSFTNYVYRIKAKSVPESTIATPGNEQTKPPITLAKTLGSTSATALASTSATALASTSAALPSTSATLPSTSATALPSTSATTLPSTSATTLPSTSATTLPSTSATTLPSTSATTLPSTSAATTLPSTSTTALPSTSASPTREVTTKPSSTAPSEEPCQDKNPDCPNINSGFCNDQYPSMLEQCPKTCGVCK